MKLLCSALLPILGAAGAAILIASTFSTCDLYGQLSEPDSFKKIARNNPLDSGSARPLQVTLEQSNGGIIATVRPSVRCALGAGIARYDLQISESSDFFSPLAYEETGIAEELHRIATPLANHGYYHWRIRPRYEDGGAAAWSVSWTFSVALPVPALLDPADTSMLTIYAPTLTWEAPSGADSFEIQVGETADFSVVAIPGISAVTQFTISQPLTKNKTYFWRVRCFDAGIPGDWSESHAFSIPRAVFRSPAKYDTSGYGYLGNSAIGDLNGDGRNDVAVLAGDDKVLVFYQGSAGDFATPVAISTNGQLHGLVIQDSNHDGLPDLIVCGGGSSQIASYLALLLQDSSTHALGSPQYTNVSSVAIGPLCGGDIDGDTLPDIAILGIDASGNLRISVYYQESPGGYSTETVYAPTGIPTSDAYFLRFREIHAADMNHDGSCDLVFHVGPKQLAVLKRNSARGFDLVPSLYSVVTSYSYYSKSFALGDLDGDGLADLAASDESNGPIANIFLQKSDGTLSDPILRSVPVNILSEVDIADLDKDGLADLVFSDGGSIAITYNLPDHSYSPCWRFSMGMSNLGFTDVHESYSIGDVTNDGYPDIVCAGGWEGLFVLVQE